MKIQKLIKQEIEFLQYLLELEAYAEPQLELRINQLENLLEQEK